MELVHRQHLFKRPSFVPGAPGVEHPSVDRNLSVQKNNLLKTHLLSLIGFHATTKYFTHFSLHLCRYVYTHRRHPSSQPADRPFIRAICPGVKILFTNLRTKSLQQKPTAHHIIGVVLDSHLYEACGTPVRWKKLPMWMMTGR